MPSRSFQKQGIYRFLSKPRWRKKTHLEKTGIISKTETVDWGTPLVPVLKKYKSVRLCADYRVTVNPFLEDKLYPMPVVADFLTHCKEVSCLKVGVEVSISRKPIAIWNKTGLCGFSIGSREAIT